MSAKYSKVFIVAALCASSLAEAQTPPSEPLRLPTLEVRRIPSTVVSLPSALSPQVIATNLDRNAVLKATEAQLGKQQNQPMRQAELERGLTLVQFITGRSYQAFLSPGDQPLVVKVRLFFNLENNLQGLVSAHIQSNDVMGRIIMGSNSLKWQSGLVQGDETNFSYVIGQKHKAPDVMDAILGMLHALEQLGQRLPITLVTDAWATIQTKTDIPVVHGPLTAQWLQIFLAGAQASSVSHLKVGI